MMPGMAGDGAMTGMLWAGALLIVVPLLIGIGVAVVVLRNRAGGG